MVQATQPCVPSQLKPVGVPDDDDDETKQNEKVHELSFH
jgi:hypothetical protein